MVTALLLTFFFGPFGLFYVSIFAALMMLVVIPAFLMIVIFTGVGAGFAFVTAITSLGFVGFLVFYFPICMIWASIAVNRYNRKIHEEEYWAQNSANRQQQLFAESPKTVISNSTTEKKNNLIGELAETKQNFEKGAITETEYAIKKDRLERQIAILTHNESQSPTFSDVYQEQQYGYEERKKGYAWIIILLLAILIPWAFMAYEKGWLWDKHTRDKEAIKDQIEKTYFGISNGAYTSATIQGIGAEGLPFYNQNLMNASFMGLIPLANLFGYKVQIEPKNIDVYNFIDDNTAQVKYDLVAVTGTDTHSGNVDMIVKKIGGYWKLDGERFMGDQTKNKNKEETKKEIKKELSAPENETDDNHISESFLNNPKSTAYKITAVREDANNSETQFRKSDDEQYFIFTGSKIFLLVNGSVDKVWHISRKYMDDEYEMTQTTEGDTFASLGNITITNTQSATEYEGRDVPVKGISINKSAFNKNQNIH